MLTRERISSLVEGGKKDFGEIITEIQEPISFEDMLEGAPCGACQGPVEKAYMKWSFPSDINEHRMIVVVDNTPGYRCACGCNWETPSYSGLVQAIDQALPVFQEKGFKKSVRNLEWTKEVVLEIILPERQKLREFMASN